MRVNGELDTGEIGMEEEGDRLTLTTLCTKIGCQASQVVCKTWMRLKLVPRLSRNRAWFGTETGASRLRKE